MSNLPSTSCSNPEHSNQPIRYLCLEENCKTNRLICHFCVRDSHRKHSLANLDKYIEPFARLGMNSQYPDKETCCESLQDTITTITDEWEKVSELVTSQSKFLEENILYQLNTITQTFSEELVESIEGRMSAGTATQQEVQSVVKKINLLGGKNFNDPEKLMETLQSRQKGIESILQDTFKKLSVVFFQFQKRIKKLSFENVQLPEPANNRLSRIAPTPEIRERPDFDSLRKPIIDYSTRDHQSIISDSQQRQISDDPIKLEADDSNSSLPEIQIGLDNQDGIAQMKSEMKSKIRRVVVTCCKNPEAQISKILSLTNLEELEIYWYELAKKEYLVRIINALVNLKVLILNCANQFDEECCRLAPKRLTKLRKLEYGWDFYNSLREYDENIYFRMSPYTNRGCPLKTSVTREMVVGLKRLENVWLGDFMYFRPSNNEIPFRKLKQFTLGQTRGKYFRIPDKLCVQLKDMRELLSLAILHVKIDEKKLLPILVNNPYLKTFVIEGCEDITDESLKIIAKNSNLIHLSIRESKVIEGSPIWEMTNLTTLVLVECSKIKRSQALTGLSRMRFLTYLNLYGNKWVDDELFREIPNQEHFHTINIGRTGITDASLEHLWQMKQLKTLCLDCNKISGAAISQLARQVNGIEKISLWGLDGTLESGCITNVDLQDLTRELALLSHISIRYCRQLKGHIFLNFQSIRFIEADRENLPLEVQTELEKRGVKLLLDLQKQIIEDDF